MNKKGTAGGGHAANYLPGLGGFMHHADVYAYPVNGLVRFFVDESAQSKLDSSSKWVRQ